MYDALAAAGAALYIAAFVVVSRLALPSPGAVSDEIVVLRALGSCAIVLLHIILCIGPLARLEPRFLPLLYNRRHLGVMTFLIALAHGILAVGYYHGFGVTNPLVSLLTSNTNFFSLRAFPFQLLGLLALLILFLMAATSHDFWLKNLSAVTWKRLHMLVYLAYALLVAHVALGALQTDRGRTAPVAMMLGATLVVGLHIAAGLRETRRDVGAATPGDNWIDAGPAADLPESRARTVCAAGGERIAIFRHNGKVSAVTNVCAHQGGPLGEGTIIDGCITCPWHGWQYRPHDGCSPPPFTEKIATYQVRIVKGRVEVNPRALPPGTPTEPATIEEAADGRA
jgi:nitrite reductase/ring-hydroxylating ferredoxin subunit/DMSO/TMAO reductase YedYZ heme-binding membrane subunit